MIGPLKHSSIFDDDDFFCRIVNQQKAVSNTYNRDPCQGFLPLQITELPRAGFENVE